MPPYTAIRAPDQSRPSGCLFPTRTSSQWMVQVSRGESGLVAIDAGLIARKLAHWRASVRTAAHWRSASLALSTFSPLGWVFFKRIWPPLDHVELAIHLSHEHLKGLRKAVPEVRHRPKSSKHHRFNMVAPAMRVSPTIHNRQGVNPPPRESIVGAGCSVASFQKLQLCSSIRAETYGSICRGGGRNKRRNSHPRDIRNGSGRYIETYWARAKHYRNPRSHRIVSAQRRPASAAGYELPVHYPMGS
jgi:hypothetical protein